GPEARLIDAEVSARWKNPARPALPYVTPTLGLFKTPFGFELLQNDTERLFLERSNGALAFFPGVYDLGVRIQAAFGALRSSIALMNGAPIGDAEFPGKDPTKSKDLVARLGVEWAIARRVAVRAGFSGLSGTGFHKGTRSTKDVLVWRDANENGLVEG